MTLLSSRWTLTTVASLVTLIFSVGAAAEPTCSASGPPLTVTCEDGDQSWEITHASTSAVFGDRDAEIGIELPTALLALDGSLYFAVGGDLLGLHPSEGVIHTRVRFPGRIRFILNDSEGNIYVITGARQKIGDGFVSPDDLGESLLTIRYRPGGPRPVGLPFTGAERTTWTAYEDARIHWVHAHDPEIDREHLIWTLEDLVDRDRTNPFYAVMLAFVLGKEDVDDPRIDDAFRQAASTPGAHWMDLVRLSLILDLNERKSLADIAEARAREQMAALGLDPARVYAPGVARTLLVNSLNSESYSGIDGYFQHSLANREYQLAHQALKRFDGLFPNLVHRHLLYEEWARVLADQGLTEPAHHWQVRAEEQRTSSALEVLGSPSYILLALVWPFLFGALFVGWLLTVFLMGIRHGTHQRRATWRLSQVFPGFSVLLLVLVALLSSFFWLQDASIHWQWQEAQTVPSCVVDGPISCPQATWFYRQNPEMMELIEENRHALEHGEAAPTDRPSTEEIRRAIDERAAFVRGRDQSNFDDMALDVSLTYFVAAGSVFIGVFLFLALFGIGFVAGWKIPGVGKWMPLLFPGGSYSLRWISLIVVCLFCAGLGGLAGAWSPLESHRSYWWTLEVYGFSEILGYQNISHRLHFAWLVFAAVILHGLGVWLDSRGDDP